MSESDEPRQPSVAVAFMVELEQEMSRTEVEVVENEERKLLYRRYKAVVAVVVAKQTTSVATPNHDGCSEVTSPCGNGPVELSVAVGERRSATRPYRAETDLRERQPPSEGPKEESLLMPCRSSSPLTWWDGVHNEETHLSSCRNRCSSTCSKMTGGTTSHRSNGLYTSPGRKAICCSVSLSVCGGRKNRGGDERRRWDSSSNLHSKAAATRCVSPSVNDPLGLNKRVFRAKARRQHPTAMLHHLESEEKSHLEISASVSASAAMPVSAIPRPAALITARFRRLYLLQKLLRVELEREAMEDWQVLRDEFVWVGRKLMEAAASGPSGLRYSVLHSVCKKDARCKATAASEAYSWEREKRRQERRFQSPDFYSPHNGRVTWRAAA
ncbi:putative ATP-dependent DEAD/H RNA helicase [Trypanosoma grayi]|uniref:putative ATP-dependent DEAD/H RNA helicase n=1 Tax=Trypanosoma grayi TaxID=71804 RepID=UPI0004F43020|nr:putative ATP-dependent DEAD/H RNA helicase [Trypanosoma grayi]KEG06375.1 putative ATP-dependent DEAD/H RNA helicase [Trypanosoma grayi]